MEDSLECYGMHENANTTFQMQETTALLNTVILTQPRASGGGGDASSDDTVIALADEIEEKLPSLLDVEEAGATTFVVNDEGIMDSIGTVLSQEVFKFNRLLRTMSRSLSDIKKAIKGLILMSSDLDKMYDSFMFNKVPALWEVVAYPSLKPLAAWVIDLINRVDFMRQWLLNGQPDYFSLPAFFFPQGFLTGALQKHARKYQIAINSLDFSFQVLDKEVEDIEEGPEDGIIVHGLWMEGARWQREEVSLAEAIPGEMFSKVPPIHFIPHVNYKAAKDQYSCPVYKTSVRAGMLSTTGMSTNFVISVELPTQASPDKWVFMGTAMLLNLDF
jgi:dynein heavy chain